MYRRIQTPSSPAPFADTTQARAVAVFLFEDARQTPAGYTGLDRQVAGLLERTLQREEFKASRGTLTTLYPTEGPDRLLLAGLGKREALDAGALRIAAARLAKAADAARLESLELRVLGGVGDALAPEPIGHALADGLSLGGFHFDAFKGKAGGEEAAQPIDLTVSVDPALHEAMNQGLTIGRGVTTARRLAATPPNVAHPRHIAEQCRELADEVGLRCELIETDRARELGMGGLLAVGRAGSQPPVMIVLEWDPSFESQVPSSESSVTDRSGKLKTQNSKLETLLLVGKAITFDTGGYSLKVGGTMAGMKYDKCGGMAVIGAMEAIARLKLPRRVVAVIPCAENLIDEKAYRVDDILTFCNGVTSEVTNTDAEGRLVLADALAYGTRTYQPAAVIDLATLTGGVVVALGSFCAGMFCNDEALGDRVAAAADFTGEKVWPLPLWDDHRAMMKGTHADLVNSADRKAHPIQGAAFLSYFVGEDAPTKMPTTPWAHLDIAGVASTDKDTDLFDKGPTGWGVRLLTRLAAS